MAPLLQLLYIMTLCFLRLNHLYNCSFRAFNTILYLLWTCGITMWF